MPLPMALLGKRGLPHNTPPADVPIDNNHPLAERARSAIAQTSKATQELLAAYDLERRVYGSSLMTKEVSDALNEDIREKSNVAGIAAKFMTSAISDAEAAGVWTTANAASTK
ncbi:unnamed protein product [Caenorhabditis sp. 36 PRJEB53466]|nr:unnamed protein product [Caenorhabditis sp. 36 PRJEB53466]